MKPFRILLTILLCATMLGLADACPTCKESLSENGGNMVRGYFWSILFMMSMPFLVFSGLCTMFYLDVRRARHQQGLSGTEHSVASRVIPIGSA